MQAPASSQPLTNVVIVVDTASTVLRSALSFELLLLIFVEKGDGREAAAATGNLQVYEKQELVQIEGPKYRRAIGG